jgi:hypothetical protein
VIYAQLKGGIGNQMFQYACARALAARLDTELTLDISYFTNQNRIAPRKYELDRLSIDAHVTSVPVRRRWPSPFGRLPRRHPPVVEENSPRFQPPLRDAPDGVLLSGYWQSERYFVEQSDLIRSHFRFRDELSPQKQDIAESMTRERAVSLHIRRGDYVGSERHPILTLDYYRQATAYIAARVESPHFFVFSDDPEWSRTNLDLDHPTTIVEPLPDSDWQDLWLISRCESHILANSSFSWWGAWLDPRPDKIVVAPTRWFGDESRDTSKLLPDGWTRLTA